MKSLTTNLMVAAAALMVVAGSASAQPVQAEIPFAFNVHGAHMAPGTYQVSVRNNAGLPVVYFVSKYSKGSALAAARPGSDAPRNWVAAGRPMLSFACIESRCDLKAIWFGEGVGTLAVPTPKNSKSDFAGVEIVNIRGAKAD